MISSFEKKRFFFAPSQLVGSNTSVTSSILDTAGYDYAEIDLDIGVTNNTVASYYVQESDISNMASATNFANTIWGTSNNDTGVASTLPGTTANTSYEMLLDLRGHKRYLQVVLTTTVSAGTNVQLQVSGNLYRPYQTPVNAVQAGLAQRLIGGPFGG